MNLPIRSSLSSRASARPASPARVFGAAALSIGCAALSLGCAALPVTGVTATGEPLRIVLRRQQEESAEERAKAAENARIEAERRAGLASMPPELPPSASAVTRWEVFQGPKKLDDEDFFRIGGDIEAADQIRMSREHAVGLNRAGWVVLGVGVAAVAGGLALRSTMTSSSSTEVSSPLPSVGGVVAGVGVLASLIGGSVAAYGVAAVHREHPLDDMRRARQVERAYNLRLTIQPADGALSVATPKGAPSAPVTTPPATLPAVLPGAPLPSAMPPASSVPPASSAPPPPSSSAPSPSSAPPLRAP
jgi:hypothetical protein